MIYLSLLLLTIGSLSARMCYITDRDHKLMLSEFYGILSGLLIMCSTAIIPAYHIHF